MTSILQLTDTHLMDDPAGRLKGFCTERGFLRCLEVGLERVRPDALLLTGDLVHDAGAAAYRRLREHCRGLGLPVYALPGNHDDPALMRELLAEPPIAWRGHAELGGWRLMLLDSTVPGRVGGRLGPDELRRLEGALTGTDGQPTLLCLHHQPLDIDSRWIDDIGLSDGDRLLEIVARFPSVRGLLWGHIHQEFDRYRDGVRFLGSPSTCIQFRRHRDGFEIDTRLPGYRWLRLSADGGIETGVGRCHPQIDRVVSGGQSGVDRAALDIALDLGMPVGGWCPRGRRAEDGPIDPRYPLRETPLERYDQRTEWNVRDSDATLILTPGRPSGGTALTQRLARRYGRPLLTVDPAAPPDPQAFAAWLDAHRIRVLNVAGPRESSRPGIGEQAGARLLELLGTTA